VPVFERVKAQLGSSTTDHLVLNTKVSAARFEVRVVATKPLPDGNVVNVASSTVLITDIFGDVSCNHNF
jgi:hypothetical protein